MVQLRVRPKRLRGTQLSFWVENERAVETRCFKGRRTAENLATVSRAERKDLSCRRNPGEVSETHHRNLWYYEAASKVVAGKVLYKADEWKSGPAFIIPPYVLQGCSAVTRNNYGRQSLFTVCNGVYSSKWRPAARAKGGGHSQTRGLAGVPEISGSTVFFDWLVLHVILFNSNNIVQVFSSSCCSPLLFMLTIPFISGYFF